MKKAKINIARASRWAVLCAAAVFFLFFSQAVSEHAVCPIGGFESFFTGLFGTGFSAAGLLSGMILIFLVMSVLSVVFRRAYCGYICPMGTIQELSAAIGRRVLPKKIRNAGIPRKADTALRFVKFGTLASFVIGAAVVGGHWMLPADPFIVLINLFDKGGIAASWSRLPFAVAFFAAIAAFAFFFGRGFCKYICPAGAWYAILSKASPSRVVRDDAACIGCGACTKACPMGIEVAKQNEVKSSECIGCRECVSACPAKGALEFRTAGARVPSALLPIAAAAVFAGSVSLAAASMPSRPSRTEGGRSGEARKGTDAASGASVRGAQSGSGETAAKPKVSFGGCENCSACGVCRSV